MRMKPQSWVAWLAVGWLTVGCAPAGPAVAPGPPAAIAPAGGDAPPPGYVPMHVSNKTDDDAPFVVFEGLPGSFLLFRPEAGPELAHVAAAVVVAVTPPVTRFVRELRKGQVSPEARAPFERWSRELLATGAVFLRVEYSLPRADGERELRLLVRRGGRVEAVDPGDNAVPVILLHKIPIFVDLKLLVQGGGMSP